MKRLISCISALLVLTFLFGCNPFAEMREARMAAEQANKDAKAISESLKEYALKAEAAAKRAEEAAQRAESAAALSENFSKRAEAASQKAVGFFERQLKK